MPNTPQAPGDRSTSPIIISPSPQLPSSPSTETPPPGSTRIYYGHAVGNPQQGYRFVRPVTNNTNMRGIVPGASSIQTRNDGDTRPSISPLSSPTPPPPIKPLRTAVDTMAEQAGGTGAMALEVGQAASTLMHLFSDDFSQAWLRANLSLGSGVDTVPIETRVETPFNSVSELNHETNWREAKPASTNNTQNLLVRPRRTRKQPPYNFAPILDKISRNDPEYANHPVRRVVYPSPEEKKGQCEVEVTSRVAARIKQHNAESEEGNARSSGKKAVGRHQRPAQLTKLLDPRPVRPTKRKPDSSIPKPPAKRQRPMHAKSLTSLPPVSKRTARASLTKATEVNVRAHSGGVQDRSRSQDSVVLESGTTSAPTIDKNDFKVEDDESISDSTRPENSEDEDEDIKVAGRRNTNSSRARVGRIESEEGTECQGRTQRTDAKVSTTRRSSTRSAKASRRVKKPKKQDFKRDYQRFDVRDGKGRFVKKSEP